MGNLASICINPDDEKPNTTLYAAVGKNTVDVNVEEPTEKPDFVELQNEEAKEVDVVDQYQEPEKPKESEGVLLNNDEVTTNLIIEEKPPTYVEPEREQEPEQEPEQKREEDKQELIVDHYRSKSIDSFKVLKDETKNGFDFDALKGVHGSVEIASENEIRNATAAGVLETEQDLAEPINYNEYTDGNVRENHQLDPVYFGNSGEFYHGNWNNDGLQEGKGYLVRRDGSKLEGIWSNGELVWGRIYYTDGSYYTGKVHNAQPHGNGVFATTERKLLKGTFANGQLSQGEIQYESTFYKGQVKNGVPHGFGEYRDNHYVYDGEWENGKRVNGKLTYADGTVFEGVFGDNLPTAGKFLWKNGTVYQGDLKNISGPHYGILDHPSGAYEGQWNGNLYHGKGAYTWKNANSNRYEGEYKSGKKDGKGTYYVNHDDFFRGPWKAGKPDGEGEFVRNGRVIKGRWRKGTFVNILGDSQPGDVEALNFDVEEEVNNITTLPHLTKP
jgi:hypothetical protein